MNSIILKPSYTKDTNNVCTVNTQLSQTSCSQHIKLLKTSMSSISPFIFSPSVITCLETWKYISKPVELMFGFHCTRASKWKKSFYSEAFVTPHLEQNVTFNRKHYSLPSLAKNVCILYIRMHAVFTPENWLLWPGSDQGVFSFSASNSHVGLAKNFIRVLLMP